MISIASSIRFRKSDSLLPSFDNTLHADQTHFKVAVHEYYQKLYATDVITVQAEVDTGDEMAMSYATGVLKHGVVVWSDWSAMTEEALAYSGTYYDYWEVDIDFSTFAATYIKFKAVMTSSRALPPETWYSEPVELIEASSRYLQIEFFNLENAFNVYYDNVTEANRISHLLRVKGVLRKYKPGGETSVFDNQNEVVKTSGEVKRILTLETGFIPAYLAEMLAVAMAHDKFFVNEVEFVAESNPEFELGAGDMASMSVALTQRDVIGLNTHDVGYDVDSTTTTDGMTILQELAASGQKSFAITDDHMILTITGERVAGSPVITAGTTPGGTDVLLGMSLSSVYTVEAALIPIDKASISGGTLYVTITGTGATANIYIATFKNRQ